MWDEQMPERTVLMTLALKSPETRQNKARAPGNSPVNVCTHVRVLRRAAPSLPAARQTEPTAACRLSASERFQVPIQQKQQRSSHAATHTILTLRAIANASAWC